ncbi:MAG TPA: ABC transporter substrate-binding protein [Bacteroidia bacterium]|jgi:putative ABC transport system substrate-binding protein|nr:ABC transporter substrate-binding protein [Bacteroidia bacterium]
MKHVIGLKTFISVLCTLAIFCNCNTPKNNVPVVGFADAFEDNTIAQAKQGFFDALKKNGYSEDNNTLKVIYRNAQGDIPKLTLSVKYFISEKVTLMATNPSLSTIAALQNTKDIPVFMMVSPTPQLMNVLNKQGDSPANLFGVAEDLGYIDTSFSLIPKLLKPKGDKLVVGMIYNQSEPQSAEALKRIQQLAKQLNINLVSLPVNNTADVQLVTQALLAKDIDAFFANPDNTVFGSFETIIKACTDAKVPVFTSEAGLVSRGAVAAYGADIYNWGYQAGEQAAQFLKNKSTDGLHWEMVKLRKRVYNAKAAQQFGITVPSNFEAIK